MKALFLLAFVACDSAISMPCTNIPDGGCPLSYGVACMDPACSATYACLPGNKWELRETCPPRDASVQDATKMDSARDVSTDVEGAFGGPGCLDLQLPDCSLGEALTCPSGCCGCEDLYVCRNMGWDLWGTCAPDGAIQMSTQ